MLCIRVVVACPQVIFDTFKCLLSFLSETTHLYNLPVTTEPLPDEQLKERAITLVVENDTRLLPANMSSEVTRNPLKIELTKKKCTSETPSSPFQQAIPAKCNECRILREDVGNLKETVLRLDAELAPLRMRQLIEEGNKYFWNDCGDEYEATY